MGTFDLIDLPEVTSATAGWRRRDVTQEDVLVSLDAAGIAELRELVAHLRRHPLPVPLIVAQDYSLESVRRVVSEIRWRLRDGLGFCILDRLPLDGIDREEAKALYWVIASLVARPVAQKLDGTMIYDVHDTGAAAAPGSGIRPDKTNIDLTFHNDNAYNQTMPEIVALLCLASARAGGHSRVISFQTAYEELSRRAPEVLPRLFEPFWFDRQREVSPGEPETFSAPIFTQAEGRIQARLGLHQVFNAAEMRGEPLDAEAAQAVGALREIFNDPELFFEFDLEPGQIQFADNLGLGHSRTAFVDHPEPERRRHLVRLWLRDAGDRSYVG